MYVPICIDNLVLKIIYFIITQYNIEIFRYHNLY